MDTRSIGILCISCLMIATSAEVASNSLPGICFKKTEANDNAPIIANRYHARVIVSAEKETNYTAWQEEWFDGDTGASCTQSSTAGVDRTTLVLPELGKDTFLAIQGDTCQTVPLKANSPETSFRVSHLLKHLQKESVYRGESFTVNGSPTLRWTSCVSSEETYKLIDYYFTRSSIDGQHKPVRIDVQVKDDENKTIEERRLQFLHFDDDPIFPNTIFEIPRGIVCKTSKDAVHPQPVLPDTFYLEMEVVLPNLLYSHNRQQWFTRKYNLSRYDIRPSDLSDSPWGQQFGFTPLSIIHDYNEDLEYIVDIERGNCTISPLPEAPSDGLQRNSTHLTMKHGFQLFDLDNVLFYYQGKKTVRGIPCDAWSSVRIDWPVRGTDTTVEVFNTQLNWTVEETHSEKFVPTALWLTSVDESGYVSKWLGNIYNYDVTVHPSTSFDISSCFSAYNQSFIAFSLKGNYADIVLKDKESLEDAVKDWVHRVSGIKYLHIGKLQFVPDIFNGVRVWFVYYHLLEKTDDLETESKLRKASDNGATITVHLQDKTVEIPLRSNTVTVGKSLFRKETHTQKSTGGAMAGLAFAMFLAGGFLGTFGGLYYRKTRIDRPEFPYSIQD